MIGCMTIIAAADGSSLGNPGPTGWGWYIDEQRWAAGGQAQGTNNIGELRAVLDLLQQAADVEDLTVLCDSQYVIKAITQWMPGWKRKGWKKADGKPVMNRELLEQLDQLMEARRQSGRRTHFEWVKGHAGHPLNEEADRLANGAAAAYQRGSQPDSGPGMGDSAVTTAPAPATIGATVDAEPTLFDDELELSPVEQTHSPAHDLRLTVWREPRSGEVLNHRLEQLNGKTWTQMG